MKRSFQLLDKGCPKPAAFSGSHSYGKPFSQQSGTSPSITTQGIEGVARREWVLKKGQRRNEALDLFVYNFVALKILNPNFEVLEKNMAGVEVKPLKKVNKPYKIRREGSFVSGFK